MMIQKVEDYLMGIVIGIRFRANFSIEDQLGQIVDTILYSKNSYFSPSVFPRVRSNVGQKTLVNEDTEDSLRIDNSNFILQASLGDAAGFRKTDYVEILKKFDEQIIKGVMKTYLIKEIVRVGMVKRYLFPLDELAKSFVNKTIGHTLGGVNDINLSFSKRLPADQALVKKDVNDYYNAIFNIIKIADKNEIFMSVDFQSYYDPFLPSASDIKFSSFVEQVESFNSNKYLPWLNSNYMER